MEGRNKEFLNLMLCDGLRNNVHDILEVIPEFKEMENFNQQNPHHVHDLMYHTILVVQMVGKDRPIYLKLAALFHDFGKLFCKEFDDYGVAHYYGHPKISAEKTKKLLVEFGYDEMTITKTTTLIKNHERQWDENPTRKQLRRFISKLNQGNITFEEYFILRKADILAQNPTTIPTKLNVLYKVLSIYESIKFEHLEDSKK